MTVALCMRSARRAAALAGVLVLASAASGCSGSSKDEPPPAAPSAAAVLPRTTGLLVRIDTRSSSEQVAQAAGFLDRVPAAGSALDSLSRQLAGSGVDVGALRRAAGRELDVAVIGGSDGPTLGLARPPNRRRFVRLLERHRPRPLHHASKRGWIVFGTRKAAVDRVVRATSALADAPAYRDATSRLPAEAC